MKILIISWFFPPSSTMGALRLGKLADYLTAQGHDLMVVTPRDPPYAQTLQTEFSMDRVCRTNWIDVNRLPRATARLVRRVQQMRSASNSQSGDDTESSNMESSFHNSAPSVGRLRNLARSVIDFLNWPDSRIGWLPFAVLAGRRIARSWSPDIILASAPPFTTLFAGYLLARWQHVPWVLEFRDRWVDDPYDVLEGLALRRATKMEKRIVQSAAALVTVSEPWANEYRSKYGKPTWAVYNGFDPNDYGNKPGRGSPDSPYLRIVYTGGIYVGRRDPSALFAALGMMGKTADDICIDFFGTAVAHVQPLVEKYDVDRFVNVRPRVSNKESVSEQQRADVLLILQWNHPLEQGNVPGKLFEYLAARRPILGLGLETGVPATIIRERGAGVYSNDPVEIARHLTGWLEIKRRDGSIPPLPESVCQGFSRAEQFCKFEEVISSIAG